MSGVIGPTLLAPKGSTGNNTHTAVGIHPAVAASGSLAFQFVVEATGSTPTVTWKAQGSVDGTNWYDLAYITDASGAEAVSTRTATAVGAQIAFLAQNIARLYTQFRVVTTSNTNVTYRAELYQALPL